MDDISNYLVISQYKLAYLYVISYPDLAVWYAHCLRRHIER